MATGTQVKVSHSVIRREKKECSTGVPDGEGLVRAVMISGVDDDERIEAGVVRQSQAGRRWEVSRAERADGGREMDSRSCA